MQKLLLTLFAALLLSSCAQMDAMQDAKNNPPKATPTTETNAAQPTQHQMPAASPAMENAHKAISY